VKKDTAYLKHILDETVFLAKETDNLDFDDLMGDEVLKRACARSLEIIGEAAKNLSPELRKKNKDIEWTKIAGLRDKIIHHYFGVDWNIVWDILKNQAPKLKARVEEILAKEA
jgi:uncharacterized protein with HEPN domain